MSSSSSWVRSTNSGAAHGKACCHVANAASGCAAACAASDCAAASLGLLPLAPTPIRIHFHGTVASAGGGAAARARSRLAGAGGGRWLVKGEEMDWPGPHDMCGIKKDTQDEFLWLTCRPKRKHGLKNDQRVVGGWPTRGPETNTERTHSTYISYPCGL